MYGLPRTWPPEPLVRRLGSAGLAGLGGLRDRGRGISGPGLRRSGGLRPARLRQWRLRLAPFGEDLLIRLGPAPEPGEETDVGQVQAAEHQEHLADLDREDLDYLAGAAYLAGHAHREGDEAQVEQVEPGHDQAAGRLRGRYLAAEHVQQEDPAAARQGRAHEHREGDADEQVHDVGDDNSHSGSSRLTAVLERVQVSSQLTDVSM